MNLRRIRAALVIAVLSGLGVLAVNRPGASPRDDQAVELRDIRYAELSQLVKDLRGQVIVVDFWADYCLPCKREFPHLVELHQKYSSAGFTAIAVSLDDPHDAEARDRARNFLLKKQARFANYILNEKPEVWQQKLKIEGPPCVFIFGRKGELLKRYNDGVDYQDVEAVVVEALKQ
ncbi:MAG TPA: TlpA disulfide reductase family protein [Gemmataceae bacterium]|jgi:thiol-disulfide isomerase/thioredoxin|nr:TlpA disulfide reductase family protein [Gemmataceae bacterium]